LYSPWLAPHCSQRPALFHEWLTFGNKMLPSARLNAVAMLPLAFFEQ
jgi:hypothetical protein